MRIGLDIDNVLSNFDDVLKEQYLKHDKMLGGSGIINKNVYIKHAFDWDYEYERKFYLDNIEYFASLLKPIKDCQKYIRKLKEEGNEIYIITGRDNGEYSNPYDMTVNWFKENDIYYDKLFLVDAYDSHSKTKICLKYNIDVMIDDSRRILKDITDFGLRAIIMDTLYNKDSKEFERVRSWKEIYDKLSNKKVNVILDTDTYNECDDQFALSYLIKSKDIFNIEAITVAPFSLLSKNVSVKKGQELSYKEILKICNWLNFDYDNKVFKGSMDYMQNGYDEDNDAVNKIIEVAQKNDKTYIMAIGAITNVALAIKKEPKIIDRIEIIWLGGNEPDYKDNLEFNFKQDVKAVKTVFDSDVKLTILPCHNVVNNLMIDVNTLKDKLENKSELCNYLMDRFYNDGYHGVQNKRVIWDISVIAYMINKAWFETKDICCPIIKDDTSYEPTNNKRMITFVTKLDRDKIYEDLFKRLVEDK